MHYFDNTQKIVFIEVVEQRQKNSESSSTKFSTCNKESSTKVQVESTNTEVHYENQDSFKKLKMDADKLLMCSTRLGNISGLCVSGKHTKQVRCTAGNEGYHSLPRFGVLTSIVLEPSQIARVTEAQLTATKLKKCRDLADSLESAEFGYRTVEDFKVLYRLKSEGTQLVLPKYGGLRQLGLEELHASKLSGHLRLRKILTALQQRVWWPAMIQTVTKFVQACPIYQKVKDSTQ